MPNGKVNYNGEMFDYQFEVSGDLIVIHHGRYRHTAPMLPNHDSASQIRQAALEGIAAAYRNDPAERNQS